ncbi:ABC transporter permease [Pseudonocardia sp. RS010]|uniref:ABC transporter permease n=1 Tax=Pseudonocardia sp. RS010 TaxID=3385979 RepID=UPI0039A3D144
MLLVAVWQLAASQELIDTQLFPSPVTVLEAGIDLAASGVLWPNFLVSLVRVAVGLALGASAGLVIGLTVGFSRRAERLLDPTLQMLRTVPLLAVTPLFILWFGFGELSKVLLIATGAFFPMYVNAFLGVRSVDARLFEVTQVLEFSKVQQLRRLVIPSAMPNLLLGLRLSVGLAWLCLVVAELMGAESGVGYLIQNARSLLDTSTVLVGVAVFAAVGKASDSVVRWLEARLLTWRDGYSG